MPKSFYIKYITCKASPSLAAHIGMQSKKISRMSSNDFMQTAGLRSAGSVGQAFRLRPSVCFQHPSRPCSTPWAYLSPEKRINSFIESPRPTPMMVFDVLEPSTPEAGVPFFLTGKKSVGYFYIIYDVKMILIFLSNP
jgi:hypothetical protein